MPRYSYNCKNCEKVFQVFHGMNEEVGSCPHCGCAEKDELVRIYDKISVRKKSPSKTTAAERIKEFIENSREELEQQKQDSRKEHD